jgi:hypothetical protein
MQYFLTYVLGHRSDSGKKADLGTMVHKVMEVLAGLKKFQQDNPRKKYLVVKDDAVDEVRIHKDELLTKQCVEDLVDLSFNSYKKGSKHKWTPADRKEVSRLSWLALDWNDGQFDPRYRDIVDPEPHFDIPIEEDWAKYEYEMPNGEVIQGRLAIKGTIDLVTKVDDDTIEVIDWKTGRRLDWATGQEKDFKKLTTDAQLLLYNYAISKLYPDYKQAIMSIFFIKDGGPFSMCFDKSDQDKFLDMLKNRFEEIKANVSPKPLREDRSHWKCTKLCHFYKNDWPGTDTPMCTHVGNKLKSDGLEKTVKDCTKKGFSIGYYEAPG